MSAPSRGRGGASTPRGRGANRNNASNTSRGRGRGRGVANGFATPGKNPEGLLQKLRSGAVSRTPDNFPSSADASPAPRGRGTAARGQRGSSTRARGNTNPFRNAKADRTATSPRSLSPAPLSSHRDFMAQMNERFQQLKPQRDAERKKAIQDGFLADPEKKTNLANAITPVGTCTDMCPQFERVERIVQNMVDRAEKIPNDATGRDMPSEDKMVKRFRRSAAGYDEQLPSDIRTPETLRRTLDYLLDKVVGGGERLASIHKFVWDRTRGIRNDFSIQQVTRREDVKIAVDCYERIARFHILSLHQLSNPVNLQEGEHFDAHQEREQLNNTILSLMYYYDDNRGTVPLPNEPEFRSYCILFELQPLTPDLEDRMQTWPVELLNHSKVQTALKLHAAANNTVMDQGPLRPTTPFSIAQANSGKFWTILCSQAVTYMAACVAEISFSIVRFTALDALWRSAKSSPQGQQARMLDWTLTELRSFLAFDDEDQTLEFCQAFDLAFKNNENGDQCLDFSAVSSNALDKSLLPSQQIFSYEIVEEKRFKRTLVALINGVGVAAAIRQGLVVESEVVPEEEEHGVPGDDESMFIPEEIPATTPTFGTLLNPTAPTFKPSTTFGEHKKDSAKKSASKRRSASPVSSTHSSIRQTTQPQQPTFDPVLSSKQSYLNPLPTIWDQPNAFRSTPATTTTKKSSTPATTSVINQTTQQPQSVIPAPTSLGFNFGQSSQPLASFDSIFGLKDIQKQEPAEKQFQFPAPGPSFVNNVPNQQQQQEVPNFVPTLAPAASSVPNFNFNFTSSSATEVQPTTPAPAPQPVVNTPQSVPKQIPQPFFALPPTTQPVTSLEQQITPATKSEPVSLTSLIFEAAQAPRQDQKSVFSFLQPPSKPEIPVAAPQVTPSAPSLPSFNPSTTPQGTPQRQQFGTFNPPSTTDLKSNLDTKTTTKDTAAKARISSSSSAHPQASFESPVIQQTPQPSKPRFTEVDRAALVENTSRLILTQPRGLIEYFISHHVSNLLQNLVKQYLQDRHDEVITNLRTRHLSRKFFAIWRANIHQRILNKRAKQRRKSLATAMQAERERKKRQEAELEAILIATRETKRLQEEQRRSKSEADEQRAEEARQRIDHQNRIEASRNAGLKRKIVSANDSPQASPGVTQSTWSSHKRSRTVGTMSEPSASLRMSTTGNISRGPNAISILPKFGQSLSGRSTGSADLRRSLSQKIDSTKTNYFKLKAMGLDPNTPLVPDTARSLEERKGKELEAREALIHRSRIRPSALSTSTASRPTSPIILSPRTLTITVNHTSSLPPAQISNKPASSNFVEDDDILRQLREARELLAKDEDWFKNQTGVLQKEIEEHEEFRRSQTSRISSRHESPQVTVNGLAKANGYEFFPHETNPGIGLSRTEERIRRTGAHGFATRPTGRDYVPVAMSKQSALRYTYDPKIEVSASGRKHKSGLSNNSLDLRGGLLSKEEHLLPPTRKQARENQFQSKKKSTKSVAKSSSNSFAALQNHDSSEYEDDEDESEDESATNDHDQDYVDTVDNEDELYDEEEEFEEDEDEYDEEANIAHNYPILRHIPLNDHLYDDEEDGDEEDDNDTPGTYPQFSRAQSGSSAGMHSGPGATADDAVVLSD